MAICIHTLTILLIKATNIKFFLEIIITTLECSIENTNYNLEKKICLK